MNNEFLHLPLLQTHFENPQQDLLTQGFMLSDILRVQTRFSNTADGLLIFFYRKTSESGIRILNYLIPVSLYIM